MNFKLLRQVIFDMSKWTLHAILINCLLLSTMYASDLNAQKKATSVKDASIELEFENANLAKVLQEIEAVTDFQFSYNSDDLDNNLRISKNFKNSTVAEVLLETSKRANLKFKQVDNIIHVSRKGLDDKREKFLEIIIDEIDISGKITDENGQGLPGASVIVKGTSTGATTDLEGNYKISVPEESLLTVSFVGYATQEFLIAGRSEINIQLELDSEFLEEVVVIGYGTRKKATITGAVSSIGGDEITANRGANLTTGLAGQIPGLIINQREGRPGEENVEIFIRGKATLGNNNNPLLVLDGIPQGIGTLSRLNPNDIESVTVLKDASAAIYGVNAANGVILVTTKRGEAGVAQFSGTSAISFAQPTVRPNWTNSYETALAMNEEKINGGGLAIYDDATLEKFKTGSSPLTHAGQDVDWYDETFRKWTPQQRIGMTARGGTDNTKYFVSVDYLNQEGMYRSSDAVYYKQYQFRSNLDFQATRNLKLSFDINAQLSDRSEEQTGVHSRLRAKQANPETIFTHENGLPGLMQFGLNPTLLGSKVSGYNATQGNNLRGVFRYNYKLDDLTEGLSILGYMKYDVNDSKQSNWRNTWETYAYNENTGEYVGSPSGQTTVNPELTKTYRDNTSSQLNFQINYARSFGDHSVDVFLGTESRQGTSESLASARKDYLTNILEQISAGDETTATNSGFDSEWATLHYMGRFNYNFKDKYMVDVSFRSDGSYKFTQDKRWGLFPAVSAAWRISEEPFMSSLSFIDNLKIRASFGKSGIDNTSPFQYLSTYSQEQSRWRKTYLGEDGVVVSSYRSNGAPNSAITWEEQETFDIGFDASFMKGAIDFTVDYFKNKRSSILIARTESVPSYYGITLPDVNFGEVDSYGIDANIAYSKRVSDEFSYNIGATFTYARNRVQFLDEAAGVLDFQKKEGHTVDAQGDGGDSHLLRLLYVSDGLFQNQADIDNSPSQFGTLTPGDIKYVDQLTVDTNGDGIYDEADGVINGQDRVRFDKSRTPEIVFGLNLGAKYKNFDFLVRFQGQARAWSMVQPEMIRYDKAWFEGRWQKEGDNLYPKTYAYLGDNSIGTHNNDQRSTFWLKNVSFLRVKTLEIGYSLPESILSKLNITQLRVFVNGTNLFTFDNMEIARDPELDSWRSYEISKMVTAGLNFNF